MENLVAELREVKGIKSVRMQGDRMMKIEPHKRELKGQEAEKIIGNLRSITPKITNILDSSEEVSTWEWNVKPEKRYKKSELDTSVTDSRPKGHKPAHYLVTIEK